jgi:hypothetical protein
MNKIVTSLAILFFLAFWVFAIAEVISLFSWYSLILLFFVIIFLIIRFKQKKPSPHDKQINQLIDELKLADSKADWKKRQEIYLLMLWANINSNSEKLPNKWSLGSYECKRFAEQIVNSYSDVLTNNDYRTPFKPDAILPVPKNYIRKAILFTIDLLHLENPDYAIEKDKENLKKNLLDIYLFLETSFIDTGSDDLPKNVDIESFKVAKRFKEIQKEFTEDDKNNLIDWK